MCSWCLEVSYGCLVIVIIMYIYHALRLVNALSTHMIHINLNMIIYTHVEHSPTKTIYVKYYAEKMNAHTEDVNERPGLFGSSLCSSKCGIHPGLPVTTVTQSSLLPVNWHIFVKWTHRAAGYS